MVGRATRDRSADTSSPHRHPSPATSGPPRGGSRPSTFLVSSLGCWRGGESGGPGPSSLPILTSSPPFSAYANILRSFPGAPAGRRWPARTPNASGNRSYSLRHLLPTPTARYPTGSAMAVCLDNQIFYNPGLEPASCGPRVREGGLSAVIFGVPLSPPLPQNAHDPQHSSAGESQKYAILIPSDDELDDKFDDLDG
ncbi:hypothetical protein B0T24DRAFT_422315 [Lasiosphaeria ovina]|uniref:Uncharacterized protein n=1 Tax=Lasiosphaeria ovina TaxID=92902 RepID=A0AAE0JVI1_9PEZI|nr:hypothetical protein B0T24DRAFT_422315 [Lasiosphaeria ovina]